MPPHQGWCAKRRRTHTHTHTTSSSDAPTRSSRTHTCTQPFARNLRFMFLPSARTHTRTHTSSIRALARVSCTGHSAHARARACGVARAWHAPAEAAASRARAAAVHTAQSCIAHVRPHVVRTVYTEGRVGANRSGISRRARVVERARERTLRCSPPHHPESGCSCTPLYPLPRVHPACCYTADVYAQVERFPARNTRTPYASRIVHCNVCTCCLEYAPPLRSCVC